MDASLSPKAIVIGAGIAGIAAAIRLRAQGYEVAVLEANRYPGGKLSEVRLQGFRFDAGPSLFTMPQYVEELFALHGRNPRDYFDYAPLPVVCRYFYPDGQRLDAPASREAFERVLVDELGEDPKQVRRFFQKAERLYGITAPVFLQRSLHKLSTYLQPQTLRSMLQLHRLEAFSTMHQANAKLFRNPKTVQLFDRYATYNGSNPYEAPATLNVISHLEHELGAYFPAKGMFSITQSLVRLAKEVGVSFQYSTQVEEIVLEKGAAAGVRADGQFLPAQLVVSNIDIANTYRRLLPGQPAPERTLDQPKSSSAMIFYWGMNRRFEALDVHNIFFSAHYEREFQTLFQAKSIDADPTVYVFVSAKAVPADAPEGSENWFVMVNAPNDAGQDWEALRRQTRQAVLRKLSEALGTDLAGHIVCEDYLDPRRIEARSGSVQGALYGNSSNNRFAAFLRHPNFSGKIPGLYCCGGSVHPGGGIPLCLLSAKIVGDLVAGKA